MTKLKFTLLAVALLALLNWSIAALACPFCSAVSQTLSQEIAGADVAVIARLVELPPEADPESDQPITLDLDDPNLGMAEFEVVEAIRGENPPQQGSTIKVVYFGSGPVDEEGEKKSFLINGFVGESVDWRTPLPLSKRGIQYIKALGGLPEKGPDRLEYFLGHLEDKDPLLAQDAYDEFGRAPYEEVVAVGDRMDRPQLIAWIEDPQIGPTRRRLYLTMLGICGQEEDIAVLESLLQYDYQQLKSGIAAAFAFLGQTGPTFGKPILNEMIKADVRRKQQCLDALIAAYLKLKGPAGLPLIEKKFLTNPAAEYAHVYAAVMALRFHGEETDSIPRDRLLETVRLLLDNEEIAEQVIPDLARWEDWTVMDQLVTMFKNSEEDSWVRQPVVSYLLAATDQAEAIRTRAESALAELEAIDPKTVERAKSYMAFGLFARPAANTNNSEKPAATSNDESQTKVQAVAGAGTEQGIKSDSATNELSETKNIANNVEQPNTTQPTPAPVEVSPNETSLAASGAGSPGPNRMILVGGPLIAGVVLFGVFALLLRGADVRSSSSSQS